VNNSLLPRCRFAPSPNGRLHLGHAYSALFTARSARLLGGTFLLRIEDIDRQRSKPEFVAALFEDLAWLGLDWAEPVLMQSTRFAAYEAAAERLSDMGLLYPCFCSRAEVAERASGRDPDGAPIYDGRCRHMAEAEIERRLGAGEVPQLRLNMGRAAAMAGMLTFTQCQPQVIDRPQVRYAQPMRWGDVVVVRRDTPTSYHLSVVVDDADQAITHVTRGRDMEAATDIHVLLQMLLGLPSPIYTFHPLILDATGDKLSKSRGSQSLADLRAAGRTAAALRAELGFVD